MESRIAIRTYGFCELSQLYFPTVSKKSAARNLRLWMQKSIVLQEKLRQAEYIAGQRLLTPKQVTILVEHFGEP